MWTTKTTGSADCVGTSGSPAADGGAATTLVAACGLFYTTPLLSNNLLPHHAESYKGIIQGIYRSVGHDAVLDLF